MFAESSAKVQSEVVGVFGAIVERIHASSGVAQGSGRTTAQQEPRRLWMGALEAVAKDDGLQA